MQISDITKAYSTFFKEYRGIKRPDSGPVSHLLASLLMVWYLNRSGRKFRFSLLRYWLYIFTLKPVMLYIEVVQTYEVTSPRI
jgi:hypothetical protein